LRYPSARREAVTFDFGLNCFPVNNSCVQIWTRRFRPNIVVQLASGEKGFAENAWIGHTLAIGTGVRLNITGQVRAHPAHRSPA
jgi:hypothetical protein